MPKIDVKIPSRPPKIVNESPLQRASRRRQQQQQKNSNNSSSAAAATGKKITVKTPFTPDTPAERTRLRLIRTIFHNEGNHWGVFHFTPIYDPANDEFVKSLCTIKSRRHVHDKITCNITGSGIIYFPRMNNIYELEGRTFDDPRYGRQLQFRTSKRLDESAAKSENKDKDINDFMSSQHVDPAIEARKFMRLKYKASAVKEIIEAIDGQDKFVNAIVEKKIPERFVATDKADELAREFHIYRNFETVSATLADMGIGQAYHARIIEEWGPICVEKITKNPYVLMEIAGFGFKKIDQIVMSKDPEKKYKFKIANDSSLRIGAAYSATLEDEARQGHTWTPLNILTSKTKKLLNIKISSNTNFPSPRNAEYRSLFVCVDVGNRVRVYNRKTFLAEAKVKEVINEIIRQATWENEITPMTEVPVWKQSPHADIILNDDQVDAAIRASIHPFSIITGGPGTGKTFLIKAIVDHFGVDECAIIAPTGKAAVRITQATSYTASTIHKYLGITIGGQGDAKELLGPKGQDEKVSPGNRESSHTFSRLATYAYPDNPAPHSIFIIDEFSMVDVELFAKFLSAIRPIPKSRVILIGDPDQLPSIGPGNVLHDLISLQNEGIPVTVLREPVRTSRENLIYKNAAYLRDITHGTSKADIPTLLSNSNEDSEFCWERLGDPQDIVSRVVKITKEYYDSQGKMIKEKDRGNYETDPMNFESLPQVIIPTNQGAVSVESANKLLQTILNPYGDKIPGTTLRIGDKVMCTQNNYEVDMMNGDVGTVFFYSHGEGKLDGTITQPHIRVKFFNYGFEHVIPQKFFNKLTPAYAVTIHKSQGSEYDEVIVALHKQHYNMLYRNLLYTAITRAKKHLRLIGSNLAVRTAMRTSIPIRRTSMSKFDMKIDMKVDKRENGGEA